MQMSGGPKTVNLKLVLLVIAIAIAAGTLFFTQKIVKKLQDREKKTVELYAEGLKYISQKNNIIFLLCGGGRKNIYLIDSIKNYL